MTNFNDKLDEVLDKLYKQVRNRSRVILYTDLIGELDEDGRREQVLRDDMWAISTEELDKFKELASKQSIGGNK